MAFTPEALAFLDCCGPLYYERQVVGRKMVKQAIALTIERSATEVRLTTDMGIFQELLSSQQFPG